MRLKFIPWMTLRIQCAVTETICRIFGHSKTRATVYPDRFYCGRCNTYWADPHGPGQD